MIKLICFLIVFLTVFYSDAQTFMTRNGFIGFYSKTPMEDIRAENNQVYAVIDASKKNIAFSLLVKGFLFRKQLMQTHFNENYVESDLYPKSNFVGTYTGDVDLSKEGIYPVQAKGQITLHGVTQTIEVPATIEVRNGKLLGKSNFQMDPADYQIKIPSLVREKIAKLIDVRVSIECNPLN